MHLVGFIIRIGDTVWSLFKETWKSHEKVYDIVPNVSTWCRSKKKREDLSIRPRSLVIIIIQKLIPYVTEINALCYGN